MSMLMVEKVILITVIATAVYTDIKYRKIYNISTLSGIGAGFILAVYSGGLQAFWLSLTGFGFGLALLLPLFYLGGIGGGDVKLLSAIGAIGGYPFILWASIYMAIIGVFMAVAVLLLQGGLKESAGRIAKFVQSMLIFILVPETGIYLPSEKRKISLPYGTAIGLGALAALFFRFKI